MKYKRNESSETTSRKVMRVGGKAKTYSGEVDVEAISEFPIINMIYRSMFVARSIRDRIVKEVRDDGGIVLTFVGYGLHDKSKKQPPIIYKCYADGMMATKLLEVIKPGMHLLIAGKVGRRLIGRQMVNAVEVVDFERLPGELPRNYTYDNIEAVEGYEAERIAEKEAKNKPVESI